MAKLKTTNVEGSLIVTGNISLNGSTSCITAPNNYGFKGLTTDGVSDYMLWMNTSNQINVGYNNRQVKIDCINPIQREGKKLYHEGYKPTAFDVSAMDQRYLGQVTLTGDNPTAGGTNSFTITIPVPSTSSSNVHFLLYLGGAWSHAKIAGTDCYAISILCSGSSPAFQAFKVVPVFNSTHSNFFTFGNQRRDANGIHIDVHYQGASNPIQVRTSYLLGDAAHYGGIKIGSGFRGNKLTEYKNYTSSDKPTLSELGAATENHGNHVPKTEVSSNNKFLRCDNTWVKPSPEALNCMPANKTFRQLGRIVEVPTTGNGGSDLWFDIATITLGSGYADCSGRLFFNSNELQKLSGTAYFKVRTGRDVTTADTYIMWENLHDHTYAKCLCIAKVSNGVFKIWLNLNKISWATTSIYTDCGASTLQFNSNIVGATTGPQNIVVTSHLGGNVGAVNGFTIGKSVPSDAVFTDTKYSAATTSASGLMSSTDKTKLDGIASGANNYTHPTGAGNNHIPSGGGTNQYLKYSASGTAVWSGLPGASTSVQGIVQLNNSTSSTSTSQAATAAAVKAAYDKANHSHLTLNGTYVSGGNEKPNYFGANNLKLQMLQGIGTGWGWCDTLWMSSYSGGDVKGSNQLVISKGADKIGFRRQNYDSTSWGTTHEIYHTGRKPTVSEVGAAPFTRTIEFDYLVSHTLKIDQELMKAGVKIELFGRNKENMSKVSWSYNSTEGTAWHLGATCYMSIEIVKSGKWLIMSNTVVCDMREDNGWRRYDGITRVAENTKLETFTIKCLEGNNHKIADALIKVTYF